MSQVTEFSIDITEDVATNSPRAFPRFLNVVIVIAAWQTYRIAGAIFWGELEFAGGAKLPDAWAIPLAQDTITGLLAPIVVFWLAMRPNVMTYALGVAWFVFGIVDFTNGLVVEGLYPPKVALLGENVPAAFLTSWLVVNMVLQIGALALLLSPAMRSYFIAAEGTSRLGFMQSPMTGKWIVVVVVAALNGIFFKTIGDGLDAVFGWLK